MRGQVSKALALLLLAFVLGTFCYLMLIYPPAMDELEFMRLIDKLGLRYTISRDSLRVGNMLGILFLYTPKIIPGILLCIALISGVLIMAWMSEAFRSWKRLVLFTSLFVFGTICHNCLFVMIIAFNYILAIPLLFGAIYIYNNPGKLSPWIQVPVCILIGAWHEGFALALLCGWGFMCLFYRKKPDKRQLACIAYVLIGFAVVLAGKGLWQRQTEIQFRPAYSLYLISNWIYFVYLIVWLIALKSKATRQIARSPLPVFAAGTFVFIPIVIYAGYARAGMPSALVCCCAMTIVLPPLLKNMRKLLKTVLATVVFMITAVHTGAMAAEGTIILRMYGKAIEEIKNAPKDRHYVFTPVRYSWDASILALNRPQNSIMDPNEWSMLVVSDYYRKKRDIIAVPEELRNFRADMGCPIAGEPDMRLWNGHLVYLNPTDTLFDAAYTRYERGGKAEFAHLKRVVFPGADGENYIYIIPHRSVANIFAGDPVEINLIHYSKNK